MTVYILKLFLSAFSAVFFSFSLILLVFFI